MRNQLITRPNTLIKKITRPNTLILYFTAYLIHYFYISKLDALAKNWGIVSVA